MNEWMKRISRDSRESIWHLLYSPDSIYWIYSFCHFVRDLHAEIRDQIKLQIPNLSVIRGRLVCMCVVRVVTVLRVTVITSVKSITKFALNIYTNSGLEIEMCRSLVALFLFLVAHNNWNCSQNWIEYENPFVFLLFFLAFLCSVSQIHWFTYFLKLFKLGARPFGLLTARQMIVAALSAYTFIAPEEKHGEEEEVENVSSQLSAASREPTAQSTARSKSIERVAFAMSVGYSSSGGVRSCRSICPRGARRSKSKTFVFIWLDLAWLGLAWIFVYVCRVSTVDCRLPLPPLLRHGNTQFVISSFHFSWARVTAR